MKSNHQKIKKIVKDILNEANKEMHKKIDKAIQCGALDIDSWDENSNPMIIPKIITIALLENEADQYKAGGTSFEKEVKKESKNLKLFL